MDTNRVFLFGPLLGAALAAGIGFLFGADAEAIVFVFCVAAVLIAWIRALIIRQRAMAENDASRHLKDSPSTSEEEDVHSLETAPLLDALPIGVLVLNDAQQVILANRMICEIFALPQDTGYPVETLRAQRLLRAVEEIRNDSRAHSFEMTLSRATDLALRVHVGPVIPDGHLIIAVEDITQARLAGEVHRDFVANASHELKTPLAVVSGLIETLQGPAKNDPVGTERFLNRLASQTQRMTGLIDDLMSLNRIEMNARVMPEVPSDLRALVAEAVDALSPAAEAAGVTLELQPGNETATVLADRDELGQLFGNLIDNAIKYGGKGGSVDLRIMRSDDPREIGVCVSDSGPGIAREHLPRLTERFYRVDIGRSREHGGTGLGLAICKHIVQRHRGRLDVESSVGKGARFTVWLPCVSNA